MIQFLRGSKAQLESNSTIIAAGQPVFESDTGQLKIGTGSSRYSSLPYVGSIFEYDPGSGGESSTDITWSGDYTKGYIDFPNGLRYSWANVSLNGYEQSSWQHTNDDKISWNNSTMVLSQSFIDQSYRNWKSVVVDQTATVFDSRNQRVQVLSYGFDDEGPTSFGAVSFGGEYIPDAVIRVRTWSHD